MRDIREIERLIAQTGRTRSSSPADQEDYQESPVFADREWSFTNTGEHSTYTDRSGQDYTRVKQSLPAEITDDYWHDMQWLIQDRPQSQAKPVDAPELIELNFRWHTTSHLQTTRNRLRYGTLHTRTQRLPLWGFDVWTEFKSHIHPQDWPRIGPLREQLAADIALDRGLDGARLGYWIVKDDQLRTRPGAWIISTDNPTSGLRSLVIGYQNQIVTKSPLRIRQQTAVKTCWEAL